MSCLAIRHRPILTPTKSQSQSPAIVHPYPPTSHQTANPKPPIKPIDTITGARLPRFDSRLARLELVSAANAKTGKPAQSLRHAVPLADSATSRPVGVVTSMASGVDHPVVCKHLESLWDVERWDNVIDLSSWPVQVVGVAIHAIT